MIETRNKDVQVSSLKSTDLEGHVTEMGLLQKALPFVEKLHGRLPSHTELREIQKEYGVDFATAVLWRALHCSELHGPFARQVRGFDLTQLMSAHAPMREITRQFEVVLVASNLPESGRAWGDHVELWRLWARELGFTTDDIQTSARNTVAGNARVIADHLADRYHPHRILVTFGQGTSEFRFLLEKRLADRGRNIGALASVRAWLNVCGSFGGSQRHANIQRNWKKRIPAQWNMRLRGRQPLSLSETSSDFSLWRNKINVPPETLVASLFGVTYGAQMPQGSRATFLELAKSGPNDGAVLALDAIAHPGLAVPVQGLTARGESQMLEPMLKKLLLTTADTMAPMLTPMVTPMGTTASLELGRPLSQSTGAQPSGSVFEIEA